MNCDSVNLQLVHPKYESFPIENNKKLNTLFSAATGFLTGSVCALDFKLSLIPLTLLPPYCQANLTTVDKAYLIGCHHLGVIAGFSLTLFISELYGIHLPLNYSQLALCLCVQA